MKDLGDWALVSLTGIQVIFTLVYGFRSPWKTNRVGRVFLAKSVVLSIVLLQVSASVIWGVEYPFRVPIRTTIYWCGALAYVVMLVQLIREQQEDRARRRREREYEPASTGTFEDE